MEQIIKDTILEPALAHREGIVATVSSDPDGAKRRIFVAIRKLRESGDTRFNKIKVRVLPGNSLLIFVPKEDQ